MLTTAMRCNYWPKAPDAVGMQAALRSNCHREVGHLPCCQAQVQRRTPPLLAQSTCCFPGRPICRPASRHQHRHHAPFSAARQQRQRMTIVAAAPPVRATAASDAHPDILSVVYDEKQLAEAVTTLGRQLAEEYADRQPLLLGALTGAFVFCADLARAITPVPAGMTVDFFAASSYGAATVAAGDVSVNMLAAKIDVSGRHVLVVEDIIDTGATLKRVVARLQEAGAASVKVVVLLDKAARRKVDIQPDYCALPCPDEFVVGYGLDFNEAYRSLPYVGVLKPELYAST